MLSRDFYSRHLESSLRSIKSKNQKEEGNEIFLLPNLFYEYLTTHIISINTKGEGFDENFLDHR